MKLQNKIHNFSGRHTESITMLPTTGGCKPNSSLCATFAHVLEAYLVLSSLRALISAKQQQKLQLEVLNRQVYVVILSTFISC